MGLKEFNISEFAEITWVKENAVGFVEALTNLLQMF